MEYIRPSKRNQWEFYCLEETLDAEHPACFIEAFVDKLVLKALAFVPKPIQKEGRPAFYTEVFLKLYLYGYLNGIRISRRLEKKCGSICMREPFVKWCGRRTPLVYTDGAAYSIIASAFYGMENGKQEFMHAVSFFSEELAFLMLSLYSAFFFQSVCNRQLVH